VQLDLNNSLNSIVQTKFTHTENIALEIKSEKEILIFSDESRVLQIIQHLLSNAFKYASSRVEITSNSTETEFQISIADDGTGFNDTSNVFNLFEQLDSDSLTREAVGVGTGLFIVKQLCDRMAYTIELLDSKELGGAQVVLSGAKDIR